MKPSGANKFAARLCAWFEQHARDLRWRREPTPYHVWVSEIMLQQTQVATVVPYFERFIARFPDVQTLATASEHDVLAQWSGLGYYRRARMLHASAREIVANHGGEVLGERKALLALPGIGRYTAGAILSIAFNQPEPIVDGNVERVFARITRYCKDIKSPAGQKAVWQWAAEAVREAAQQVVAPRVFNQALMELGATLCGPSETLCIRCPVREDCEARKRGDQRELPKLPKREKASEVGYSALAALNSRGHVFLVRRKGGSLLPDELWELPHVPVAACDVGAWLDIHVRKSQPVGKITQSIMKYRLTVNLQMGQWTGFGYYWGPSYMLQSMRRIRPSRALGGDARIIEGGWFKPSELDALPMASITRKLLRLAKLLP
ncbi:MAG: A/G-specific adenine glycosylase [Planctomycetes bacterium]|nr:A/G-specific adenine glycosylase [Planctomycetota bacterium]